MKLLLLALFTTLFFLLGSAQTKMVIDRWDGRSDSLWLSEIESVTFKPALGEMVFVQGGTFLMGSNSSDDIMEQPVHSVTLSSFYIDMYEVTVAQYRAYCTATGTAFPSTTPTWGWNDTDPMVYVSWHDARAYASWAGKRLPTEAEWEYAARGGIWSQGCIHAGSNTLEDVGWFGGNSGGKPHAVGSKLPNELGLYDMSGNAGEWVRDYWGVYPSEPVTDPIDSTSWPAPVIRGGYYGQIAAYCTVSRRNSNLPIIRWDDFGFRCARSY